MKIFSLNSKDDLLNLKDNISNYDDDIYFESYYIKDINHIRYRIRKSKGLPRIASGKAYKTYLEKNKNKLSTDFLSLGKDTKLVIPIKSYANIYQFAKYSTNREWLALFNRVKKIFDINDHYISTHGQGVPWLHIRIEKRPKYYKI